MKRCLLTFFIALFALNSDSNAFKNKQINDESYIERDAMWALRRQYPLAYDKEWMENKLRETLNQWKMAHTRKAQEFFTYLQTKGLDDAQAQAITNHPEFDPAEFLRSKEVALDNAVSARFSELRPEYHQIKSYETYAKDLTKDDQPFTQETIGALLQDPLDFRVVLQKHLLENQKISVEEIKGFYRANAPIETIQAFMDTPFGLSGANILELVQKRISLRIVKGYLPLLPNPGSEEEFKRVEKYILNSLKNFSTNLQDQIKNLIACAAHFDLSFDRIDIQPFLVSDIQASQLAAFLEVSPSLSTADILNHLREKVKQEFLIYLNEHCDFDVSDCQNLHNAGISKDMFDRALNLEHRTVPNIIRFSIQELLSSEGWSKGEIEAYLEDSLVWSIDAAKLEITKRNQLMERGISREVSHSTFHLNDEINFALLDDLIRFNQEFQEYSIETLIRWSATNDEDQLIKRFFDQNLGIFLKKLQEDRANSN